MVHKIKFYPLGNADSSLILLEGGKQILIDYANMKSDDKDDKRIDLPRELDKDLNDTVDVVVFSHADRDHINRFSEYFFLEHDKQYQTENRKKIADLWVPAAALLKTDKDIDNPEAKVLKAEIKYRLKTGKGVKVFSGPKVFDNWLKKEGINKKDVEHLVVDAGTLVSGWSNKDTHGVEFFVHSPFEKHCEDGVIDNNEANLILQATFNNAKESKVIFGADGIKSVWNDIVDLTKKYKNENRLEWDVFHVSHHSSYLSLNDEKGDAKTVPTEQIKWMFESKGNKGGLLISASKEKPINDDDDQPPHRQAVNYYESVAKLLGGEFKITMEFPSKTKPETMVIILGNNGAEVEKKVTSTSFVSSNKTPRAGRYAK